MPPRTSPACPWARCGSSGRTTSWSRSPGPNALLTGELDADAARRRLAAPLALRKLAGVLGESRGLGTDDPRVVVGIGINAGWPAADFPAELAGTMTSLHEASGGRPIEASALLDAFLDRLEARVAALHAGFFDLAAWTGRQATTGRLVTLDDGPARSARSAWTRCPAASSSRIRRPRAASASSTPARSCRLRLAGAGV